MEEHTQQIDLSVGNDIAVTLTETPLAVALALQTFPLNNAFPSILTTPVGTQHLKQQLRNFALGMLLYLWSCKASQEEWLKLARIEKKREGMTARSHKKKKMDTISSSFISLADSVHSLAVAGSTEGFPGSKTKQEAVSTPATAPSISSNESSDNFGKPHSTDI